MMCAPARASARAVVPGSVKYIKANGFSGFGTVDAEAEVDVVAVAVVVAAVLAVVVLLPRQVGGAPDAVVPDDVLDAEATQAHVRDAVDRLELLLDVPARDLGDLAEVAAAGAARGLVLTQVLPMPANNFSLVLRRGPRDG